MRCQISQAPRSTRAEPVRVSQSTISDSDSERVPDVAARLHQEGNMHALILMVLLSCVGGSSQKDPTDTDTDTPCVDRITDPAEVLPELLGLTAFTVLREQVWADVSAYTVACEGESDCIEANCTGAETDAEIAYTQRWAEVTDGAQVTRTGTAELVAVGPTSGASWSRLELTDAFVTVEYTGPDREHQATQEVSGSWSGTIAAHLPADASFTASRADADSDCCWSSTDTTVIAGCETTYAHEAPADGIGPPLVLQPA